MQQENDFMNELDETIVTNPSTIYHKKSKEAISLIERNVYQRIAQIFYNCEENILEAIEAIELLSVVLLRKSNESEDADRKALYAAAVELYTQELKKIYKGEI